MNEVNRIITTLRQQYPNLSVDSYELPDWPQPHLEALEEILCLPEPYLAGLIKMLEETGNFVNIDGDNGNGVLKRGAARTEDVVLKRLLHLFLNSIGSVNARHESTLHLPRGTSLRQIIREARSL